LNIFFLRFHI